MYAHVYLKQEFSLCATSSEDQIIHKIYASSLWWLTNEFSIQTGIKNIGLGSKDKLFKMSYTLQE